MVLKISNLIAFVLLATPLIAAANSATFECVNQSEGTRIVKISGDTMTVVNPNTPQIIFTKKSKMETRGDITKHENDAWIFLDKEGAGSLTNKGFGDKYGCMKTGQMD